MLPEKGGRRVSAKRNDAQAEYTSAAALGASPATRSGA